MKNLCWIPGLLLVIVFAAFADTIRVPSDQPTIQAGIDAAVDEDTVLVASGTYTGDGNRDIDFLGKAIVVRSENGPGSTVVDCQGSSQTPHRGFYFHGDEGPGSRLEGFTITNGYAKGTEEEGSGGGIRINSSPFIYDCVLTENEAEHRGGGIEIKWGNPVVSHCTVTDNRAGGGGGIRCGKDSNATIQDCILSGNYADAVGTWNLGGGGIYCSASSPFITRCVFERNRAALCSGGMSCVGSDPVVTNCIFYGNDSVSGGGLYLHNSSPAIINCTMTRNTASNGGGAITCY